jgi:hypothetical protein
MAERIRLGCSPLTMAGQATDSLIEMRDGRPVRQPAGDAEGG